MSDIEADLYGDVENDEDLEAELLALEGKKASPKRKPRGIKLYRSSIVRI